MDESELRETLDRLRRLGGDHFTCEVKRSQGGLPASLWETISAFANAQGGTVILGVDEKSGFSVVGVNEPARMESELGAICAEMEPAVRAEIITHEIDDKNVVTAHIPATPRDQRPCYKRDKGPWAGSRLRVSDGDRKLTDFEVAILLANRSEQKHDLRAVTDASLNDLDPDLLTAFLRRVRDTKGPIFSRIDDEQALVMLNVMTRQGEATYPTLAGLLAFGVYPQQFEPQLDLTLVAYPTPVAGILGPSGERFTENRAIDGPIPLMVTECIRALKRNMRRRSIVSGLYRVDEWEYPEEVLREALVNALVHRDYSEYARGMQVQVELYPDRLVIRNPGGLYGPVEVASLGVDTISSSRNKALLKIMEDTPYGDGHMVCENRGSGIARMRMALTESGMEPPRFSDDISSFTAEFPNHTLLDEAALEWLQGLGTEPLTRSQMTALVMMRNGAIMTNSSYRTATGVLDSRVATKELKDLVDRDLAIQSGTRGGASYSLAPEVSGASEDDLFGDVLRRAADLLDQQNVERSSPEAEVGLTELQRKVLAAMGDETLSRAEIEKRADIDSGQASGALKALRARRVVNLVGKPRSKQARWVRLQSGSQETGDA